jgi:hypothetical protein
MTPRFAKEGCMAEALVEARAADPIAAIADSAKMAERFNTGLLLEGCAERRFYGSSCYWSDWLGARFMRSQQGLPGRLHDTTSLFIPPSGKFAAARLGRLPFALFRPVCRRLHLRRAANNRPLCKLQVLIFSRRRREIAAIGGRAVYPAATFIGGHLG